MSLDRDEYNKRIGIVETRRRFLNVASIDFLDATPRKLDDLLNDANAHSDYSASVAQCIDRCRRATEKQAAVKRRVSAEYNVAFDYRAEVVAALTQLLEEFTAQRNALRTQPGTRTAASPTPQKDFVTTNSVRNEQTATVESTPDALPIAGNAQSADNGSLSGSVAGTGSGSENQVIVSAPPLVEPAVESEDWKRKYEEINALYTKTEELLAQAEAKLDQANAQNRELEAENARLAAHFEVLENTVSASVEQVKTISQGYDAMREQSQEIAQEQRARQQTEHGTQSLQQDAVLYSPSLQRFLARLEQIEADKTKLASSDTRPSDKAD